MCVSWWTCTPTLPVQEGGGGVELQKSTREMVKNLFDPA